MAHYHNVFAFLDENDVVQDVVLCQDIDEASLLVTNLYVSGKAVCVNDFDVKIGDFYRNRTFYRCVNPGDYSMGFEVNSTIPLQEYVSNLSSIIEQQKQHIEYLENLLRENGLDKLLE